MDDCEDLVLLLWHDKGAHTSYLEVEIINDITPVVEMDSRCEQLRLKPGAYPCCEVLASNLLEQNKLLKLVSVDLFTDFQLQVHWQLLNELVKACEVGS